MADYNDLMALEKKQNVASPTQKATPASLLANQQRSKEVNQRASKQENQQISMPASELTSKEVNQQTNQQANKQTTKEKKKYGTYLSEVSISAIQILAIQTKRKDHEVLQEIVDMYFANKK